MYRDFNLFELCEKLKYKGSDEPIPEALIWFLFTGELPTENETTSVIHNLNKRATIPQETKNL